MRHYFFKLSKQFLIAILIIGRHDSIHNREFAAALDVLIKLGRRHWSAAFVTIQGQINTFFLITVSYRRFFHQNFIAGYSIFQYIRIVFGHAGHHIDCTAVFGAVVDEGAAFNIDAVCLIDVGIDHAGNRAAEAARAVVLKPAVADVVFSGIKRLFRCRQCFSRCYLHFFRPESDCAAGTVFVLCLIIVAIKHAVLNVKPLAGENCSAGCRVIALESAVDNMGYRQVVSLAAYLRRNKRILKIKRTASTDVIFLQHGYSCRLLFINVIAGKRTVNNLADITAAFRSDRSAV